MKKKIFVGVAGVLLASSTMFAQWRDRDGHHPERYERRGGVYLGVAPGYYGYTAPAPYVDPYATPYANQYAAPYANEYAAPYTVPGPYVEGYVGSGPYYGGAWFGGRRSERRYERNWNRDRDRGYSGYRR